jgi:ubiquitin-protein ligase
MIKRLAKELKNLDKSLPKGISVGINDDDFSVSEADIEVPGMQRFPKFNLFKMC